MSNEIPSLVRIGTRCYRQFIIQGFASSSTTYKTEKANLLIEDDGESEDEENVNVDIGDFESFGQKKIVLKQEEGFSETINFNPANGNYWVDLRLPVEAYTQIYEGRSLEKQRKIENEFKVILKGSPSVFSVEIKAHSHEPVIKAHRYFLETFKITPKPDEYIVKSDKIIAIVNAERENKLDEDAILGDEVLIEEYPNLVIKYDNHWKGFATKIPNFPKECSDFLLFDKGKVIKRLKAEMKGNVEYQLNRQEGSLDIIGWTEEQTKEGYACFIRSLKNDRSLDAFILSRPQDLPSQKRKRTPEKQQVQKREKFESRNERKFTHFLSVNLENNSDLVAAQKEISSGIPNLAPFMEILPNRFHVTIAMLSLEDVKPVIEALNEIKDEIASFLQGNPIELTFDKPGFFGKPTEANVLYMSVARNKELDKLNEVAYKIHNQLMKKGILTMGDLKKQSSEIRGNKLNKIYHMTLAKNKGSNKTLNVAGILDKRFDIKCHAFQIELMSLNTPSANSSYPILYSMKLIR